MLSRVTRESVTAHTWTSVSITLHQHQMPPLLLPGLQCVKPSVRAGSCPLLSCALRPQSVCAQDLRDLRWTSSRMTTPSEGSLVSMQRHLLHDAHNSHASKCLSRPTTCCFVGGFPSQTPPDVLVPAAR